MTAKRSMLIVDDDEGTCETLSDIFEAKGLEITKLCSGEDCLEVLKKRSFDVILMDIKMGGINGVETYRRIKDMQAQAKVIMMTAYGVNDLVLEAEREGVYKVVHKPLDLDKLIAMVRD